MSAFRLRVATYNVRKAVGLDRRRDPERVMRVIAGLGADIVALQEADRRLPPREPVFDRTLIERVTGLRPVPFEHGRRSLGWHGNGLLVGERVEVLGFDHHDLPGVEPRGAVEALVRVAGCRLRIFGVHLGLMRVARRAQLTALLRLMAEDRDTPTLIAGDFNERSLRVGLGRLAGRFSIIDAGPTFHARSPIFPLDRIAVTDEFALCHARVVRENEARLASDHLPMLAEFVVTPRPVPGAAVRSGPEAASAARNRASR